MASAFEGSGWNAAALPDRNPQQDSVTPSRSTEKEEEYLVTLTFESLGQALAQASDDSFVSRLVAHNPGSELIEIAMTFHNKGQSGVFVPLDGHLSMTGNLNLGTNDITGAGDITMTGNLATAIDVTASGDVTSGDQFLAAAGDETLPGYAFTDEPDTGMFTTAANELAFTTGGSERMHIGSTGMVGIGVSPSTWAFAVHTTSSNTFWLKKTTNGGAEVRLEATSGDSKFVMRNQGANKWSFGNDSSLSNSLQISRGATLGTNPAIAIHTSEDVTVGANSAAAAQLHVVQPSTTGAQPCLELDQDDVDEPFIEFDGTEGANATSTISTHPTAGTIQEWAQVSKGGTKRWIPLYDDPSA